MSFASVKAALVPLLVAGVDGLMTGHVFDRNQLDSIFPPVNLMPCVLLRDRPSAEVPLALGAADRVWWCECVLWNVYAVDTDQGPFDTMREQLAAVLRSHMYIGGNAGDLAFGTQVYTAGNSVQMSDKPAIPSGMGQILRHCVVSTKIREGISFSGVV